MLLLPTNEDKAMRELSEKDIELASGGLLPLAAVGVGGLVGAGGYMINVAFGNEEFRYSGLFAYTVAGAASFGIAGIGAGPVAAGLYGSAAGAAAQQAGGSYERILEC